VGDPAQDDHVEVAQLRRSLGVRHAGMSRRRATPVNWCGRWYSRSEYVETTRDGAPQPRRARARCTVRCGSLRRSVMGCPSPRTARNLGARPSPPPRRAGGAVCVVRGAAPDHQHPTTSDRNVTATPRSGAAAARCDRCSDSGAAPTELDDGRARISSTRSERRLPSTLHPLRRALRPQTRRAASPCRTRLREQPFRTDATA
jgi:hypothetical protein